MLEIKLKAMYHKRSKDGRSGRFDFYWWICLDAVTAAKREGADVLGVVAIFTYQLGKADKKFAELAFNLETLSSYTGLIHLAEEQGFITS